MRDNDLVADKRTRQDRPDPCHDAISSRNLAFRCRELPPNLANSSAVALKPKNNRNGEPARRRYGVATGNAIPTKILRFSGSGV